MEHSLAQTPTVKEPEEVSYDVKSEDNAITNKVSEIKLKSFSKPVSLKQTQRFCSIVLRIQPQKKLLKRLKLEPEQKQPMILFPMSINHIKQ